MTKSKHAAFIRFAKLTDPDFERKCIKLMDKLIVWQNVHTMYVFHGLTNNLDLYNHCIVCYDLTFGYNDNNDLGIICNYCGWFNYPEEFYYNISHGGYWKI